jgi:hypothetical protein
MHNNQLLDPLNDWTKHIKKISSKRNKTDADHEELAKREFLGSLYLNESHEPIIPHYMLEACIREGAKKFKLGKQVQAGIYVDGNAKLEYEGPVEPEKLWEEKFWLRSQVKVNRAGVMRTRPKFPAGWKTTFIVNIETDIISIEDVDRCVQKAGELAGLGDWRPQHGLFKVISIKDLKNDEKLTSFVD